MCRNIHFKRASSHFVQVLNHSALLQLCLIESPLLSTLNPTVINWSALIFRGSSLGDREELSGAGCAFDDARQKILALLQRSASLGGGGIGILYLFYLPYHTIFRLFTRIHLLWIMVTFITFGILWHLLHINNETCTLVEI